MSGRKLFFLIFVFSFFIPAGGYAHEAVRRLVQQGFPEDYAHKLAFLQHKHPQWQFRPLYISRLNVRYSWNHVIYMETDNAPSRSLVSGNKLFADYFHKSDFKSYDANCRRASREAVAYFMDPRNFLNERDIFQFADLSFNPRIPLRAVETALRGTFMFKGKLEDDRSYAKWLYELGRKFNIDPLFLAARVRQEQGLKGTPLVSGKCGDLLKELYYKENGSRIYQDSVFSLDKYNGLYNFFNIEASGTGRFMIYLNGMREAVKGTPEMAKTWGSPQWDTRWKALHGGVNKVARLYTGNYQNTLYLQKWNVDFRSRSPKGGSRNFWGQYMQNIGAAFSESRTTYTSLEQNGLLEEAYVFLIPIYSDMPSEASPDPAAGKCKFYRTFDYGQKIVLSPEKNNLQLQWMDNNRKLIKILLFLLL